MKIPQNLIHHLISKGAPIIKGEQRSPLWFDKDYWKVIDTYSGDKFRTNKDIAEYFIWDVEEFGIKYSASRNWKDGSEEGFDGTDAPPINNYFISCIIVINNEDATEYKFASRIPYGTFASQLAVKLTEQISLEQALDSLRAKIKKGNEYFRYENFSI